MTQGSFVISSLAAGDLAAVAAAEELCFSIPWSKASLSFAISEPLNLALAARDPQGKLLGYAIACCLFEDCEVLNLAVLPEARRQGVGRELLRALLSGAEKRGCVRGLLEVRASNEGAKNLYLSEGFGVVGRRPRYYHSPTEDALLMEKAFASSVFRGEDGSLLQKT